ncbi:MAG: ABC transporter permease [Dysgonamonadaceae bacterium]|jgi:ABC-2 type transport system permease protein|nr:ABC transporter permease [Dysgonamonadaceae bacterium]
MLIYLLEKEFKQFFRNSFLPRLVVALPFVALAVFPLVANMDVKNLSLAVVDNDRSSISRQMEEKIVSSGYFKMSGYFNNSKDALQSIEKGDADLLLEIPPKFEESLNRDNSGRLMIAANAVNGMKGGLGSAYLSAVIADYNKELVAKQMPEISDVTPAIEARPLFRFNPALSYKVFMIPALMAMMLAMICGFLPTLNIVSEKESGTIEQMNVTPVGKFTFILSKLIPYWTAGFVVATLCMLTAFIFYGMLPKGSILLIYLFAMMFALCFSGFGLIVSNYAATIQQAIFIMFFFVITMIFLSGLLTPYQNMPEWAQMLGNASPLKYFIRALRMIYIKGSTFVEMKDLFYQLCILTVFFNGWAILSYRKKSA